MKRILKKLIIPALVIFAMVCVMPMASAATEGVLTYEVKDGSAVITACDVEHDGAVTIPSEIGGYKVTAIAAEAFAGATEVTSVTIPKTVKTIGAYAFDGCSAITSIVIPDSVTSVGDGAFANCESLQKATIGKGLKAISDGMFEGCSALSDIVIPENIKEIGDYAFWCCDSIKSVAFYPGVTYVGQYAFYDCDSLTSVAFPETVTVISEGIFGECDNLSKISVSVKEDLDYITIESCAFENCPAIKEVYFTGNMVQWSAGTSDGNDSLYSGTVYYMHDHESSVKVTKEPTCTEKGEGIYTCTCGYINIGEVAPLGHDRVSDGGVEPTCTTDGKTAGEHCSRCNVVLAAQQKIPATGHHRVTDEAVEATCQKEGLTKGSHCTFCNHVFEKQEVIAKLPHDTTDVVTKATMSLNGRKISTCKVCGNVDDIELYNVSVVKLEKAKYLCTGKTITPVIIVKDSKGQELVKDKDFVVSMPSSRKAVGTYSVTVTLIGDYEGSKKLSFDVLPDKTATLTADTTTTSAILSWDPVEGANGYRIYVYKSTGSKTRKVLKSLKGANTYTALKDYNGKALQPGKSYKFAIRAYTKIDDETVYHAEAGVAITVKIVPATPTLKASSGSKGKVSLSWTNVAGETGYTVFYSTSKNGTYKKLVGTGENVIKATSSLKSGTKYYFKVRAYVKVNGETIRGEFSPVKSATIK